MQQTTATAKTTKANHRRGEPQSTFSMDMKASYELKDCTRISFGRVEAF